MVDSRLHQAVVLYLEGGVLSTAFAAVDCFGSAGIYPQILEGGTGSPRFSVRTASARNVCTTAPPSHRLVPDCRLEDIESAELVIIPAVGHGLDEAIRRNRPVLPWIIEQYARGARIAAVCTGVALLAATGLLDQKVATVNPGLLEAYRTRFPGVRFQTGIQITAVDRLYCCASFHDSLNLWIYLVEQFCGHAVALDIAGVLGMPAPLLWESVYDQGDATVEHHDVRIQEVETWMREHFRQSFALGSLARHFGMSPRTLHRRFHCATGLTPLRYLHALRINAAKRRLERGGEPVATIALSVGYEDLPFFRKLFRRHTGCGPAAYRRRHCV
ncbi:MAG: helix-turn-helix domain-containing protein [Puniceicoccaceae bacterium]|nr:MAG: helix-turn-helix domain-containing protein [Puniceicoccaceae bacterium]